MGIGGFEAFEVRMYYIFSSQIRHRRMCFGLDVVHYVLYSSIVILDLSLVSFIP